MRRKEVITNLRGWVTIFTALVALAVASAIDLPDQETPPPTGRDVLVGPAATTSAKLYGTGCRSVPEFEPACKAARMGTASIQFSLPEEPVNIINRCTIAAKSDSTAVLPSHCSTNILGQRAEKMTITSFLVPDENLAPVEGLHSATSVKVRYPDMELAEFDLPPELTEILTAIRPSSGKVTREEPYFALTYFKALQHFLVVPVAQIEPKNLDGKINPADIVNLKNGFVFEIKQGPPVQKGGSGGWIFDKQGHGVAIIEAVIDPQKLELPPSPFIWFIITTRPYSIWPQQNK